MLYFEYGRTMVDGIINDNPVKCGKDRIYIAVARTFLPNPENKPQVDHIDTNRRNNVVTNLRWVTNKENMNNEITRKHCSDAMKERIKNGVYYNFYKSLKGKTPWNKGLKKKSM